MKTKEIEVSISRTINLGNYESAKVTVGETVTVDSDDPALIKEQLFTKLSGEVNGCIQMYKHLLQNMIETKEQPDNAHRNTDIPQGRKYEPSEDDEEPDKDIGTQIVNMAKGKSWMWSQHIYPFFHMNDESRIVLTQVRLPSGASRTGRPTQRMDRPRPVTPKSARSDGE